jgi:hypothetical protein
MAKFMLLYRGPATPAEQMSPEQSAQVMQAWGTWMGKVGDAIVDGGTPFGERTAVHGDGSSSSGSDLNGYTVVEAESLEAARALCDGHPFLSDATQAFSVEIYECVPVEM